MAAINLTQKEYKKIIKSEKVIEKKETDMTQNKLSDLNNHLFAELERLGDEDLKGEALDEELKRAKSIAAVASQIVQNGNLVLRAAQFADEKLDAESSVPKMLME
ncbi:MAG: hypothetical protein PHY71_02255 [Bacteroidaceae bacterium]|nr:hypothetical protein [Bacteroidaceae bacterium]